MEIVITIPKEFEEHFKSDRFEDSLARIASDIESFGFQLAGRYEQETITMLREAIKNGTPLPEQRWIPCSERLPDWDEECLTIDEGDCYYIAYYNVAEHTWWSQAYGCINDINRIVAWMPLPEPYKAESEDEE